jgi:hypothetical protein
VTYLTWYRGPKEAILSLEEQPNRCPETPESVKLRHLLYGHKPHIYRVIYRVTEKSRQVDLLHVRHGAPAVLLPVGLKPERAHARPGYTLYNCPHPGGKPCAPRIMIFTQTDIITKLRA